MKNIKKAPIWLLWKKEVRNGRPTKVPYCAPGKLASSTDHTTWNTYEHLKQTYSLGDGVTKGLGIVFEQTQGIVGIDFDHCVTLEKKDGSDSVYERNIIPDVLAFIKKAQTYTEYSPSGTGIHLLFKATEPIALTANKHHFETGKDLEKYAVEIYTTGRYFTFTEKEHEASKPLRSINQSEFIELIETLGYPWKKETQQTEHNQVSISLEDSEILERIKKSKGGEKVIALMNGDTSEYSNDESAADMALCMHLAFWTQKNAAQVMRLWLQSKLGARKKTQEREDYRVRTVTNAIEKTSKVYTLRKRLQVKSGASVTSDSSTNNGSDNSTEQIDFLMTDGEKPRVRKIGRNVQLVFQYHPEITERLRYNSFAGVPEIYITSDSATTSDTSKNRFYKTENWKVIEPFLLRSIIDQVQDLYPFFDTGYEMIIKDEALRVAFSRPVSPPLEYMRRVVWDGVPRLDTWLHEVYGAPVNAYHTYIGRNWLKYMMKRLAYPGCQFDHVLVTKGRQGFGKSTILRALCRIDGQDYFTETADAPDNSKEFALNLQKNLVVEFAEGAIAGYKDQKKVKSFITKTVDKYRPPYMKGTEEFPRQCVFAMTTNDDEFLTDKTGERRYWIVEIPETMEKGNWEWVADNNIQLLAEAFTLIDEPYQFMSEEVKGYAESIVQGHKEIDPLEEMVVEWYEDLPKGTQDDGVSVRECAEQLRSRDEFKRNNYLERDVAKIFTSVLKLQQKRKVVGTKNVRVYIPTSQTRKLFTHYSTTEDLDF